MLSGNCFDAISGPDQPNVLVVGDVWLIDAAETNFVLKIVPSSDN